MKVLHVNNYVDKGGAEVVFNKTLSTLKERSNIINHVAYVPNGSSDERNGTHLTLDSWEFYSKVLGATKYIFNFKNYKVLKDEIDQFQPDVIHLHNYQGALSPSILLAIKHKKKKCKVVQTIHDYHPVCPNSSAYDYGTRRPCLDCVKDSVKLKIFFRNCDHRGWGVSILKGIRSLVNDNIINQADVVDEFIVPSNFLKSVIGNDPRFDGKKITVVDNPVDLQSKNEKKPLKPAKEPIVVFFGRLSREKNIPLLIDGINSVIEKGYSVKGIIIGAGEMEGEISRRIDELELNEHICVYGHMPRDELNNLLSKVMILVIPSMWYETFGLVLYEAVGLDIYPIVSNLGALPEGVSRLGVGEVMSELTHECMAKSIIYALNNYKTIKFENSKKYIFDELGSSNYVRKLLDIYGFNL